jgi:hypothetical protein
MPYADAATGANMAALTVSIDQEMTMNKVSSIS